MLHVTPVCAFFCWVVSHCIHMLLPIYAFSTEGHLGYFQLRVVVNKATVHTIGKYLQENTFLLLLNKFLWVELLSHIVDVCLALQETTKNFSKYLLRFRFPPQCMKITVVLHSRQLLLLLVVLMLVILMEWNGISLFLNMHVSDVK